MNEKDVESYLVDGVRKLGGRAYKFTSPGNAGVPDRLVCLPGGLIYFVETKAPGKTERKLQTKVQEQLRALGCIVFGSVDSCHAVDELLRYWRMLLDKEDDDAV